MPSEMIERVAKAICAYDGCTLTPTDTWNRGMARAILEAMREPTEEMLNAGSEQLDCPHEKRCWQAMIEAAL